MKKLTHIFYVIVAIFLCTNYSYAQKVKYDDDTIKVDNKPYAIMKKQSVGPLRNDFVVRGFSGTELLYFKSNLRPWRGYGFKFGQDDELYYEIYFTATGNKANLKSYKGSEFAKLVVENNLVKDNAIDPESEKRFMLLYNGTIAPSSNPKPAETTPAVVVNINTNSNNTGENNSSTKTLAASKSPVFLNGNKIMQDDKIIGKFRQDTTSSTYSQKAVVITIYSEGGEKVAEATAPVENPQEWSVKIVSENKSYTVLYDAPSERENLFKWLADKKYLTN